MADSTNVDAISNPERGTVLPANETRIGGKGRGGDDSEEEEMSDSELLEQLEAEVDADDGGFDMGNFRERRMEQLRQELSSARDMRESAHGAVTELTVEREVIETTAREKFAVVHFYHREFQRCKIMDRHLELLAPHHFRTRFLRVFVENVPWLVEKLKIKVLPCVACFVDGACKDRIIGFEDLGNSDSFATGALEWRLARTGVISSRDNAPKSILGYPGTKSSSRPGVGAGSDDDDFDDD